MSIKHLALAVVQQVVTGDRDKILNVFTLHTQNLFAGRARPIANFSFLLK